MTDATRADLLATLEEFGTLYPDMRFGQSIANLVTATKIPCTQTEWAEAVWDIEDRDLLAEARRFVAERKAALAGSPPSRDLPTERPTGEGRTPESIRRTWLMLVESLTEFAEGNPSALAGDRDREAIAALKRALDVPNPASTSARRPSLAS